MLILNNKELNLTEGGRHNGIEKYVLERLDEIKSRKEPVFIENKKEFKKDNAGRRLNKPASMIPLKVNVKNKDNGSSEQWMMCNSPEMKEGKPIFRPERFACGNDVVLDPKEEAELIFFLTEFDVLKNTRLAIKNFEKEAEDRIKREEKDYQVQHVVYSGNLSREELVMLAMSWGIEKAEELSDNKLKVALLDKVRASEKRKNETARGFEEFLEEAEGMGRETEVRALVQKAIEEKVIAYDLKKSKWMYVGSNNSLLGVPPIKRAIKENILVEHLLSRQEKLEELESSMEGKSGQLGTFSIGQMKLLLKSDLIKTAKEKYNLDFPQSATKGEILKGIEEAVEGIV